MDSLREEIVGGVEALCATHSLCVLKENQLDMECFVVSDSSEWAL